MSTRERAAEAQLDAFVVDHEEVTGMPGREREGAVAIYEVADGLIVRAWFPR